jgi:hypothetical protein
LREEPDRKYSACVIIEALNEEKEIRLTETKSTPHFENLYAIVRTNSTDRIANILKIQSESKSCSFEVDTKW